MFGGVEPDLIFMRILPKSGVNPFFCPENRANMGSYLELENKDCNAIFAKIILCAALFIFAILCTVYAQEQSSTVNAFPDFYPHALVSRLQQIAESEASEVEPLRQTCLVILDDLSEIVRHLEHNPTEPSPALERLERAVVIFDALQRTWTVKTSVHSDRLPYIPSAAALEEISLALQRRIYIWKSLLYAEAAEATPITTLYHKTHGDVDRLKERTLAVEQHFITSRRGAERQMGQTWCDYLETRSWLTELDACQQSLAQPIRRVSFVAAPAIPVEVLQTLSLRANATLHRLESPKLTKEQRAFLTHPTINTWREELQRWSADVVAPLSVLRIVEQYETTGGATDMKALSALLDLLSDSKTAEYRQLGEHVRQQYGMANLRFFISSALLNNHLPSAAKESAPFREIIQDQPTFGRRHTETELAALLIEHPTRLLTSLNVRVDLATQSRTDAMGTQLTNVGQASVVARKLIELTERGFVVGPCEAQIVDHRMRLVRMTTDFDRVPLLSGMFRNAVIDQYESRRPGADAETRRKILQQVRGQVDRQVEKQLQPINKKFLDFIRYVDDEFDLRVENQNSQTQDDWLISSWGVHSRRTLMSNTPPPSTLSGSFADLKIHESLLNSLVGGFEFEGKQGSIGDIKALLAQKLKQPDLATPEENDDVNITFATHNPVTIRFQDGRVALTISIAELRLNNQSHRDFQVIVRFKPVCDSEGRLVLERDGTISLINVRAQFVLRAAFGKIFPVSRPFPLVPKILDDDPQFDYLTTGHCRIENGWLALALVEKE